MKNAVLALRISRRAVAVAVLVSGEIGFLDARHVSSDRRVAAPAAIRYVRRLIEMTQPRMIVLDAPTQPGSLSDEVVAGVRALHPKLERLPLADLLLAFGSPPPETRRHLRHIADQLFQDLPPRLQALHPFLLDASATALLAESRLALGELQT